MRFIRLVTVARGICRSSEARVKLCRSAIRMNTRISSKRSMVDAFVPGGDPAACRPIVKVNGMILTSLTGLSSIDEIDHDSFHQPTTQKETNHEHDQERSSRHCHRRIARYRRSRCATPRQRRFRGCRQLRIEFERKPMRSSRNSRRQGAKAIAVKADVSNADDVRACSRPPNSNSANRCAGQ